MFDTVIERIRVSDARINDGGFRPMTSTPSSAASAPPAAAALAVDVLAEPDRYDTGYQVGLREAAAAFAAERAALQRLMTSAAALQSEPSDELAALIGETVLHLVNQIVGEVAVDPDRLAGRARRAAALISECDDARTMSVHPDDLALLDGAHIPLPLVADAGLPRGSIRIGCSAGWIEAGTALYLDTLRAELGQQVIPS
jgi:flagellar assembly protein FliH